MTRFSERYMCVVDSAGEYLDAANANRRLIHGHDRVFLVQRGRDQNQHVHCQPCVPSLGRLGFWVLGFGFWVLGFWVWGLGFWGLALSFGFWFLGFWGLGIGFRVSDSC